MTVTPAQIKELRERAGAGMMDCKKALTETNGDIEEAIEWLRKKGLAAAAKKSGRVAAEGLVVVITEGKKAAVVEVNSETDFVARNDAFQKLTAGIAQVALKTGDADATKSAAFPDTGRTVEEEITHSISTIGENMSLRRVASLSVEQGVVATYIHNAVVDNMGKIGIAVALESTADAGKLEAFGRQIAMHIAAARPESLNVEELDASLVEKERNILIDQAMASGKPKEIAEKMVEGRIRKFYEQVVLLEQVFVIDGKAKIREALEEASKELGAPITITGYIRFELGEGIEKEEGDFANEVSQMAGVA